MMQRLQTTICASAVRWAAGSKSMKISRSHAIVEVRGFSCRRGREYALQEHTDPRRIVTTTVAIDQARWRRLPVRSEIAAPKGKGIAICRALRSVRVSAPVAMGDIIVSNILGSGRRHHCGA